MLLRLSIGWHFLYEGLVKIDSHRAGLRPFSAEPFLSGAKGPLRQLFRSLADDPDGLERLDPALAAGRLRLHLQELAKNYQLTAEQMQEANKKLEELKKAIRDYLTEEETAKKAAEYRDRLRELERKEAMRQVPFGPDRLPAEQRELGAIRDELLGPVQMRFGELTAGIGNCLDARAALRPDVAATQNRPDQSGHHVLPDPLRRIAADWPVQPAQCLGRCAIRLFVLSGISAAATWRSAAWRVEPFYVH